MRRFQTILLHLVGVLAEGTLGLVSEDLIELGPVVVHHGVVLCNHIPQIFHLLVSELGLVIIRLEVTYLIHWIRIAFVLCGTRTAGTRSATATLPVSSPGATTATTAATTVATISLHCISICLGDYVNGLG